MKAAKERPLELFMPQSAVLPRKVEVRQASNMSDGAKLTPRGLGHRGFEHAMRGIAAEVAPLCQRQEDAVPV